MHIKQEIINNDIEGMILCQNLLSVYFLYFQNLSFTFCLYFVLPVSQGQDQKVFYQQRSMQIWVFFFLSWIPLCEEEKKR